MKFPLTLILLIPALCMADPIFIEQADITLDAPPKWKPAYKDTFPNAPSNVCFPRFDNQEKMGRIEAVIWKSGNTLDEALDKYIKRFSQNPKENEKYKEVSREPFKSASGVEGIKYIFQATRQTSCGLYSWNLVRYVFRNSQGKIVCLGGFGDIEEIEQIVVSSLKTDNAQQDAAANP